MMDISWGDAGRVGLAFLSVLGIGFTAFAAWAAWQAATQAKHSVDVSRQALLASVRPLIVDVAASSDLARNEGVGLIHDPAMGTRYEGIALPGGGRVHVARAGETTVYSVPVRNIGNGPAIIERVELRLGDVDQSDDFKDVEEMDFDRVVGSGDISRITFLHVNAQLAGYAFNGVVLHVEYTNVNGSEKLTSKIEVARGTTGAFLVRNVKIEQR